MSSTAWRWLLLGIVVPALLALGGCGQQPRKGDQPVSFELSSSAFEAGQSIPVKYSCHGQDVSPPLSWGDPPSGTRSLALVVEDPDAPVGNWVHWVIFNLPHQSRSLPEAVTSAAGLPQGAVDGSNSWGRTGYGGPCPPSGTHRYFFTLYALDQQLDLAAGSGKEQLLKAMEGHVLGQAELMGTFSKP